MTKDPLGEYGDVNLYRMVANNPVNFADPFGLYPGQMPPAPPGYGNGWGFGLYDDGTNYLTDPYGNRYLPHREDDGHWRHWDKQDPNGKDQGRYPDNCKKPRKGQKKLKPDQSETDPSGDAPEYKSPDGLFFFMPLEPLPSPGRFPSLVPIRGLTPFPI